MAERTFTCFGGACTVLVEGDGAAEATGGLVDPDAPGGDPGGGLSLGPAAGAARPAAGARARGAAGGGLSAPCRALAIGRGRPGGRQARAIQVASPFDGAVLHEYAIGDGGVSTAEIAKRSWLGEGTRPAHHLLDAATGRPAYAGVVQVTALAPTALEGEALAKAAVLSGPEAAATWLPHGGVVVLDDRSHTVVG